MAKYPPIYECSVLLFERNSANFFYLFLFRNGDTYAGEYFADKMHGFGVYRFANGHRYEGAWHEGRRQGLGMYTFRTGETQAGHWQNGVLDVPSTQNATYPVSPVAVNHSKVLNAVQVLTIYTNICIRHTCFLWNATVADVLQICAHSTATKEFVVLWFHEDMNFWSRLVWF